MKVVRLSGKTQIDAVFRDGLRINIGAVAIRIAARIGSSRHRVAVICPKSVFKKAVERNRIRRVFFEAVRDVVGKQEFPLDIVINIRRGFRIDAAKLDDAISIMKAAEKLFHKQ